MALRTHLGAEGFAAQKTAPLDCAVFTVPATATAFVLPLLLLLLLVVVPEVLVVNAELLLLVVVVVLVVFNVEFARLKPKCWATGRASPPNCTRPCSLRARTIH